MDGFKNLSEGQDVAFIQTQKCGSRLKFKAALTRPSFSTITVITLPELGQYSLASMMVRTR